MLSLREVTLGNVEISTQFLLQNLAPDLKLANPTMASDPNMA